MTFTHLGIAITGTVALYGFIAYRLLHGTAHAVAIAINTLN